MINLIPTSESRKLSLADISMEFPQNILFICCQGNWQKVVSQGFTLSGLLIVRLEKVGM